MALIGRMNSLQVVKHTDFGLYLDGGADGEILLPKRYIPKDTPSEVEDWLNVFLYLDSEDKLIATTLKPKIQLGEFASLKVVDINRVGLFFDWGLPTPAAAAFRREAPPADRRLLRDLPLSGQTHPPPHRHRAPGSSPG